MPNMTVAMFRNTLNLLMNCEDFLKENQFHFDELPKEEQIAALRIIYLSKHITEHYADGANLKY